MSVFYRHGMMVGIGVQEGLLDVVPPAANDEAEPEHPSGEAA